jgi:hypothetical protein
MANPDNTAQINALKSILNSGARSITTDGVTTTFTSEGQIRKRIAELQGEAAGTTALVKPRIRGINLGGCW